MLHGARPSPEQVRQRELEAWEFRQRGWTQQAIASQLGVTQSAVSKMFQRVDRRVLAHLNDRVAFEKSSQLDQLDFIASEASNAWTASRESKKVSSKKVRKGKAKQSRTGALIGDLDELDESFQRAESKYGDARLLREWREALADKRKILGLDVAPAPQAPEPESPRQAVRRGTRAPHRKA
jgi:transcriptional regulator with XRE-family HTH domain